MTKRMRPFAAAAVMGWTALGLAGPAAAHVVFDQETAPAGQLAKAGLRIMHGCNGKPTTRVTIDLPPGMMRLTPRMVPGWTVSVVTRPLEKPVMLHGFEVKVGPARIIWEGGSLPDGAYEVFEFRAMMPDQPGATLVFPTRQDCPGGGVESWTQVAAPGEDPLKLDTPAPTIKLIKAMPAAH